MTEVDQTKARPLPWALGPVALSPVVLWPSVLSPRPRSTSDLVLVYSFPM